MRLRESWTHFLFQGNMPDTHFHRGAPTSAPATKTTTVKKAVPRADSTLNDSMFILLFYGNLT